MIIAEGPMLQLEHLPVSIAELGQVQNSGGAASLGYLAPLRDAMSDTEKKIITEVLRSAGGNKVKAAKILGIQRSILYQKIKRYKIAT
jgi:DNA-binding NtrC family response regulator